MFVAANAWVCTARWRIMERRLSHSDPGSTAEEPIMTSGNTGTRPMQSGHQSWLARVAVIALTIAVLASAEYGAWAAFVYDGGTPTLIPFAVVGLLGGLLALWGLSEQSARWIGLAAVLQVFAPTGAAWAASLILAVLGAVVLVMQWRASRRVSGRRHAHA